MICQFSVKNFKCIKNELTLDWQATGINENEESLLVDVDGEKFLPLAVIYGPNGSGKSTVLSALVSLAKKIMRPIVIASSEEDGFTTNDLSLIVPYKFSEDTIKSPTEFELFFRTDSFEYRYQLSILNNVILSESLYRKNILKERARYSALFIRDEKNVELKNSLKSYTCSDLSENLTVLSYLGITHKRNTVIQDVISWFESKFDFLNNNNLSDERRIQITENPNIKILLLDMLKEMDIDITDYRIEKRDNVPKVFMKHVVDTKDYELPLTEESDGTIKIFGALPAILSSILLGSALVIDELDAKLHPLLLKYIISLYNNPNINKKHAQLIFTSHDISTMNQENFRRDEIWFVAKDSQQSSVAYSLVEFKKEDGTSERKDAKYAKRYLEGRYGADPYLRKIINWEDK